MRNKYTIVTVISWFSRFQIDQPAKGFKYNFEIIELWLGHEAQRNHIYWFFLLNFRIIYVSHGSQCKGSFQKAAPLEKGALNRGKGHYPQQCALCSNSDWAFF